MKMKMKMNRKVLRSLVGCALASLAFSYPSHALDSDLSIYAWGTSVMATAMFNDQTPPNPTTDVDFDDGLDLDELEKGFMGRYEGIEDAWGFGADLAYIGLGGTDNMGATADFDAAIAEVFAIYRPNEMFDVLAGVRNTGLDISVQAPGEVIVEGNSSLTDIYLGGRAFLPFSDRWKGTLRADVGTGDSDLTWNVVALVNWQTTQGFAVRGGYRWLDYSVDNDNGRVSNELDLTFYGPFLGVAFQW